MAVVFPYCLINLSSGKIEYGLINTMWTMITCSSSHATQCTAKFANFVRKFVIMCAF